MEPVKEQIIYLALAQIQADAQVRKIFPPEVLETMCRSFSEVGQLHPIRVRRVGEMFVIVDGELRFRAAKMAGLSQLAAIVETKELSAGEISQRQLLANIARADLAPLEKARGIADLIQKTGWSASEAAARLGMSNASISRLLSLLSLPADVLARIETGELAASTAYELSKVEDAGQQSALAGQAASGQLTRDAVSGKIKAGRKPAANSVSTKSSRVTARLGINRSVTVSANPLTLDTLVELLEDLLGKARQARTRGLALGTFTKVLADQSRQQTGDKHV